MQSDSKLLSAFMFIVHGNPYNNLESYITCLLLASFHAGFLLDLLFHPENGGDLFR
jgi:hypothetical protein